MSKLSDFLHTEIEQRGWSKSELARRANISDAQVGDVMNENRNPGLKTCTGLARALDVLPEKIFRLAGLFPPLPASIEEENEAMTLFRQLSEEARRVVVTTMRSLLKLPISSETVIQGTPSGGKEKQSGPLLGDAILRMDNPLRICYEVLVDMMTKEQMTEFVTRLIEKVAEIDATHRNHQDDVQRPESDGRDGIPLSAIPEGNRVSAKTTD